MSIYTEEAERRGRELARYLSLCARCVNFGKSLLMLTGYTLGDQRCDGCGHTADLAQCKIRKGE